MDDAAFEAELVQAFRTPTDRPGRWEMAAAVERRIRRDAAMRRLALTTGSLVGTGIAAAGLAFAGAPGMLDEAARLAAEQAQAFLDHPVGLTVLGLALLAAALGGVAARDL